MYFLEPSRFLLGDTKQNHNLVLLFFFHYLFLHLHICLLLQYRSLQKHISNILESEMFIISNNLHYIQMCHITHFYQNMSCHKIKLHQNETFPFKSKNIDRVWKLPTSYNAGFLQKSQLNSFHKVIAVSQYFHQLVYHDNV